MPIFVVNMAKGVRHDKSCRFRLYPNKERRELIAKTFGYCLYLIKLIRTYLSLMIKANCICLKCKKVSNAYLVERLRGKIKTCTINRNPAGEYYVSIDVETEGSYPEPPAIKPVD